MTSCDYLPGFAMVFFFFLGLLLSKYAYTLVELFSSEEKPPPSVPPFFSINYTGGFSKKEVEAAFALAILGLSPIYSRCDDLGAFTFFSGISLMVLATMSLIDRELYAIPDNLNFAALFFALLSPSFIENSMDAILAAAGIYVFTKALSLAFKKEVMGSGDIIIMATMSALLGLGYATMALFLAAVLSLVGMAIKKDTMEPFVPYLFAATAIIFVFHSEASFVAEMLFGIS